MLQVWDMDIGDCVMQLQHGTRGSSPAISCMAITPDGSCCLTGDDAGRLTWWQLQTGTMVRVVQAHAAR